MYCQGLFCLADNVKLARYHSLIGKSESKSKELKITAITEVGQIMAVEHNEYKIFGVLLHPESIMMAERKKVI